MKYPDFLCISQSSQELVCKFKVSPQLDWFKGHFSLRPILPGMALVAFVLHCANTYFKLDFNHQPYCLQQLKFVKAVLPSQDLQLRITLDRNESKLQFTFTNPEADQNFCNGKIRW